ncbi:hypothetical protein F9B74_05740 [Pelistega sp. NLN82]|uniref:PD-(D/E)XK endonuclease-like domain-containing protein n=1 Tax=Pelistega ratti TaxID=2652177 RepID=A0A6L9Y6C5_9BURK|nr:PD-(D/E)XK nuclease family protein [Pelistega ratti]NEN75826.1 hypothetical protein [Pelistega ratti]
MQQYPLYTIEQLGDLDPSHTWVITANNRLAVFIKSVFIKRNTQKVKPLPTVIPYKAWITQFEEQLSFKKPDMPVVLNETAQQWWWKKVIAEDTEAKKTPLLNIASAALMANQAHQLQAEWHIDVKEQDQTVEYETFIQWKKAYQRQLNTHHYWDTPLLQQYILQAIEEDVFHLPKYLVLMGFYAFSAYQEQLFNILQAKGVQILSLEPHTVPAHQIKILEAQDFQHEVECAIHWAKQKVLSHTPQVKLAIVIPDLQERVASVRRTLQRCLRGTPLENHWHVAVGRPLSQWSLVYSALAWFRLIVNFSKGKIAVPVIGDALLHAEFAFSDTQQMVLAHIDNQLREGQEVSLSLITFLGLLEKVDETFSQTMKAIIDKWANQQQTCAQWAQCYREALEAFAFPGTTALGSIDYQVCQAFESAIKTFALLDEMLPALPVDEAFYLFEQQLNKTSFQGQRKQQVVLDIVGLYEIEGGQWDSVWVLGLTDNTLPQVPSPNPYLPIRSQRHAKITHATPEGEMQWATQLFKAILSSAAEVVLSYPAHQQDEILRPSSFLLGKNLPAIDVLPPLDNKVSIPVAFEEIRDTRGLPKEGYITGGYSILEKQSKNPLWAYATLRLHLKQLLNYPEIELNALLQGNFLHSVMEKFYQKLSNQEQLMDNDLVQSTLDAVITEVSQKMLSFLSSTRLKELFIQRSRAILQQKIDEDRDNRYPFTVEAVEKKYTVNYKNVAFTFKVDRIDSVDHQQKVLIDYKTGRLKSLNTYIEDWVERPRLLNLQLPLYATLLNDIPSVQVAGITFLGLNRQSHYEGLWQSEQYKHQKSASILSQEEWAQVSSEWRQKLHHLMDEIAQGEAINQYIHEEDIAYCDIKPFLRLVDSIHQENNNE